ncbi:sensor histidine kinase [Pseudodesulfovibrio piezophilus]|uniref:C4-dicarboxylate transport sensor protein DctB n=1 Tax=Pseudodesulfovibrio piezophilus (strain DSM 21447 / JCM 15486 / C1TLV30) TaxID=1322246 RepID=M1WLG3_PSEP2|nr:ATP-binding protein [Pseudodesulfovibrio piezophilus]CCH47815.1 putative C4-dicarboxylate transport sensor protein dctB [Pseudodesulfovibrio piezophilus C1TLV30]
MNFLRSINIRTIPFVICALILLGIPFGVALLVQYDYLHDLERVSTERLNLYESTLKSELKKFEYLPYLISETGMVARLLKDGGSPQSVSQFLEKANTIAGSSVLYVINKQGVVIAASNWREEKNFLGLDLSFRPYFQDAMQSMQGKFFGVGITIGEPGFYISHPVRSGDEVVGVAVAKIVLSPLENIWQEGGETLFVADSSGVIVLASRPAWKYRTLAPLSKATLKIIHDREQYPEFKLRPLSSKTTVRLGFAREVSIGNERFLENSRSIPGMDWTISYLMPQGQLWERTLGTSLTSFVLIGLAILTRLFFRERQQKRFSRLQAIEAGHIRDINKKLALEVEERKRTEHELRAAQEELVQAGKLAALGEMATAIAHELNQPIAAVKTYIASCRLMLKRGKTEDLDPTLQKVSELGDRMGKVTGQLKSFARKSSDKKSEFDLRLAIQESLTLMKHQFHVENCELDLNMSDDPVYIIGDRVRLEQVLINLFRNALDALQETEKPIIGVSLRQVKERAKIHVWDNGPGISEQVDKRIFEPFVTTKKEGIGVGLGLSISYKIIKDMNGDFRAANREHHGAEFFVHLPLSRKKQDG